MSSLSTSAWIAHDLGLAIGVGGTLFGRAALHPALRDISDDSQRGLVMKRAWQRFNAFQMPAVAIAALTWFVGRSKLSGHAVDSGSQTLARVKDGLMIGTVVTGVGAALAGQGMARVGGGPRGAVPVNGSGQPTTAAPSRAHRLSRVTDVFGFANLVCAAGVLGISTVLAMRAGRSMRWSVVSRFLP